MKVLKHLLETIPQNMIHLYLYYENLHRFCRFTPKFLKKSAIESLTGEVPPQVQINLNPHQKWKANYNPPEYNTFASILQESINILSVYSEISQKNRGLRHLTEALTGEWKLLNSLPLKTGR